MGASELAHTHVAQQAPPPRSLAPVAVSHAQPTPHLTHPNPRRRKNFSKEQRDREIERELQRERERRRENEIRAFREFSTKLPEKLQRSKYGPYNHLEGQEPREKERRGNRDKATPRGYDVNVHVNHRYMGTLEHLENVPPIDPHLFSLGAGRITGRQPLPDRANFPKSRGNLGMHPLAGSGPMDEGEGDGDQRFGEPSGRGAPAKQGRGSLRGIHGVAVPAPMASDLGYAHPPYPRGYEW